MVQKKTLQLVQLLRGIASLLVVLLHVTANINEIFHEAFLGNIFLFGGSGVDVFFVLSGFIIAFTSQPFLSKPQAVPTFAKRRLNRIYPIYWVVITGLLLVQTAMPSFYLTLFDQSFSNIISTYLLLPDHVMLNGVSWSLTNELFFYLIFIVAFLLPKPRYSLYAMLIYLIVLLFFALSGASTGGNPYMGLLLFPMNIEFFLGVIAAILFRQFPPKLVWPLLIAGILLFMLGATLYNLQIPLFSDKINPNLNRVVLFGVPSFCIILSLTAMEFRRDINVPSLFLKMGDASYSLYLIHLPLAVAALKTANRFSFKGAFEIHLLGISIILLVCLFGWLLYQLFERPLIRLFNHLW